MNKPVRDADAAQYVQGKIKQLGVTDVEMYWDQEVGMWCVCQVFKPSGSILLLRGTTYKEQAPQIMWWVKTNDGTYRTPSDQDVHDIIVTRKRAEQIWEKGGDWLADQFDEQDKKRDEAHKQKLHDRVREVAPRVRKAIKENNF
jgi:hypothetical protein